MEHTDEEITWLRRGFCVVKGIIKSEPSKNSRFEAFSVYSKSGFRLGTVDPITEEGRKELEKFEGKYVRFRSHPPEYRESDTTVFLHI